MKKALDVYVCLYYPVMLMYTLATTEAAGAGSSSSNWADVLEGRRVLPAQLDAVRTAAGQLFDALGVDEISKGQLAAALSGSLSTDPGLLEAALRALDEENALMYRDGTVYLIS